MKNQFNTVTPSSTKVVQNLPTHTDNSSSTKQYKPSFIDKLESALIDTGPMNLKEAKYYRDLLKSIGVKFKSKGKRIDHNPLYDSPQEPKNYISNNTTGRSTAFDEYGNLVPLQEGLIPTEVYPSPSGAVASVATDAVAMNNPILGLLGGAVLSTPKKVMPAENASLAYVPKEYEYYNNVSVKPRNVNIPRHTVVSSTPRNFDLFKGTIKDTKKKLTLTPKQLVSKKALDDAQMKARNLAGFDKQVVYNPLTKTPEVIDHSDFLKRLESQGDDYPWFVDKLGDNIPMDYHLGQIRGMGGFRNVVDKKNTKNQLQYLSQKGLMHDIDLGTPSGFKGEHFSDAMQIKYNSPGEAIDAIERVSRENPDRYYKIGQTGGGLRIWDLTGNPSKTHGARAIPERLKDMEAMGNDTYYKNMTIGNNIERIRELHRTLGYPVPPQNEIRKYGIKNEAVAKAWDRGAGLHSDVRLDEKPIRTLGYNDPNFDSGPPMGYQEMFSMGPGIHKAGASAWMNYKTNVDMMNRLRRARGLIDPIRENMGLGVLDSKYLDYTMKSLSPKWQQKLRKNWQLGIVPATVLPEREEK